MFGAFGLMEYVSVGLAAALIGTGMWGKFEQQKRINAIAQLTAMEVQLRSCAGQITDIREDLESDNKVDSLSDTDLINVPAHWLHGGTPDGK